MKAVRSLATIIASVALLLTASPHAGQAGEVTVSFLFKLSNFQGAILYSSPQLAEDRTRQEIYVATSEGISVFNSAGMEIFRTDLDPENGVLYSMAIDEKGDIFALVNKDGKSSIKLCNYRLEPQSTVEIHNLPAKYANFVPNMLRLHKGQLYLASSRDMTVVVTDSAGAFVRGYDFNELFNKSEEGASILGKSGADAFAENGLDVISLDEQGNMLFVLPILGRACRISPDGKMEIFGKRGSAPGKLGVPSYIVADKAGNYLVSDKLRSAVLIYDNNLKFVKEFSSLGGRDNALGGPSVMEMGAGGKLYVGQVMRRGVNVYRVVTSND